jgi:hypothetical protein
MPDHAGHEIAGLKVAEISSRNGAERAATKGASEVPSTRAISGWAKPHGRNHFTSVGDQLMINPVSHLSKIRHEQLRRRNSAGAES